MRRERKLIAKGEVLRRTSRLEPMQMRAIQALRARRKFGLLEGARGCTYFIIENDKSHILIYLQRLYVHGHGLEEKNLKVQTSVMVGTP
jgi:hypothetical protein